ncbi:MAG: phosphatidate cytidylyltransferase [Pirellulales bacterium]
MLIWRLILGVSFAAALAGLCWLDYHADPPGAWLFPLALLLSGLMSAETAALVGPRASTPLTATIVAGCLLVIGMSGVPYLWPGYPTNSPIGPLGWPLLGLAAGSLLAIVDQILRFRQAGPATVNIALAVFSMVYVGVLLSFAIALRMVLPGGAGMVALISMLVTVKMGDIGAYTVGRLIGRTKLAPVLSPGKTWEGAAGAALFASLGSYLVLGPFATWIDLPIRPGWPAIIVYGLLIAVTGLVGDLAESLLKRDAGVKDSSHWMPGFGGVLDLLDSILFAAPVAYLFWLFLLHDV